MCVLLPHFIFLSHRSSCCVHPSSSLTTTFLLTKIRARQLISNAALNNNVPESRGRADVNAWGGNHRTGRPWRYVVFFFKHTDGNLEMSRWSLKRRDVRVFWIELHKTDNIQGLLFWHVVVSEQQRGMCLPPQQIRPNTGRRYVCWPVSAANLQDVTLTRKHVRRKSKTHIQALAHCSRSEAPEIPSSSDLWKKEVTFPPTGQTAEQKSQTL